LSEEVIKRTAFAIACNTFLNILPLATGASYQEARGAEIYSNGTVTSVYSVRNLVSRDFERRNSGTGSDLAEVR
jgi:hypothetical protein